jgi:hypothetical protein
MSLGLSSSPSLHVVQWLLRLLDLGAGFCFPRDDLSGVGARRFGLLWLIRLPVGRGCLVSNVPIPYPIFPTLPSFHFSSRLRFCFPSFRYPMSNSVFQLQICSRCGEEVKLRLTWVSIRKCRRNRTFAHDSLRQSPRLGHPLCGRDGQQVRLAATLGELAELAELAGEDVPIQLTDSTELVELVEVIERAERTQQAV